MKVEIDDKSGFCFGVVGAISLAERSLAEGKKVWSLGDIVHNRVEMERLAALGLGTANHAQLKDMRGATVLIRAHGEPPSTYEIAKKNAIDIIDATCPVVARLQKIVAEAHRTMDETGGQVVILGKKGHAEVVGLTGQITGKTTAVVESMEDLDALDFSRPIYLLSQTTQSLSLFEKVADEIRWQAADPQKVTVHDTICRQVANREQHLEDFAARHDVIIFVSGRKSSNGKILFEVCQGANTRSYMIEDETELRAEWFDGAESTGICGATSTPRWLMEKVARNIMCLPVHGIIIPTTLKIKNMKLYISRALKYIVRMAVILAILLAVLWTTGTLDTGGYSLSAALFVSWRGIVLIGLIVIFAMMYPNISFATFRVPGDISANRDQIVDAFAAYSYRLVKERDGKMIFRSQKLLKRIMWQFDDAVTVRQNADNIEIEGLKKIISRVQLRLDAYINHQ